jgi:hypothetical protein
MDVEHTNPGALFDLTQRIRAFISHDSKRDVMIELGVLPRTLREHDHKRALDTVRALQRTLRDGLATLRAGHGWVLPSADETLLVPQEAPEDVEKPDPKFFPSDLRREMTGPLEDVFILTAADALLTGWGAICVCAAPTCQNLFVPDDPRQKYCSPRCGQQTQWARFAPKRKRDYHAEYEARITRQLGRKPKIRRRSRKPRER